MEYERQRNDLPSCNIRNKISDTREIDEKCEIVWDYVSQIFLNYLDCLGLMEENWLNKSSDLCLMVTVKSSRTQEDWKKM